MRFLTIIILSFIGITAFSQTSNDTCFSLRSFPKETFINGVKTPIAPFRWQKRQWLTAVAFASATITAYIYDKEIRQFIRQNQSPINDNISQHFLEPLGSGLYSFPIIGSFLLSGYIKDNNREKEVALATIQSIIISGLLAKAIKYSCHRYRPYEETPANPRLWKGLSLDENHQSFISGHTITAFSIATTFAQAYSEYKAVPIICYSLASLVGVSRIYDNKHWASDVIGGAALGYEISRLVWNSKHKLTATVSIYNNIPVCHLTYKISNRQNN